jgi:hypothetical protein
MPAPRSIARANKIGLNRITKFIAPCAPGWAIRAPEFLRLDVVGEPAPTAR